MEYVNKNATAILIALTNDLNGDTAHRVINNNPIQFPPVNITALGMVTFNNMACQTFSLAHLFVTDEKSSEILRSPEMYFIRCIISVKNESTGENGLLYRFFPYFYANDIDQKILIDIDAVDTPKEIMAMIMDGKNIVTGYRVMIQKKITEFANVWIQTIKAQQVKGQAEPELIEDIQEE